MQLGGALWHPFGPTPLHFLQDRSGGEKLTRLERSEFVFH